MGLDSVELLVAIEDTFGIEIPDQEAEQISTVGDFFDSVWHNIQNKESNKCKSAFLFYNFRQFFMEKYNISKEDFKIFSSLEEIIPKDGRKSEWLDIQKESKLILPKLALPNWLNNSIISLGLLLIVGGLIAAFILTMFFNFSNSWWFIPIGGIGLTIIIEKLLRPYRTRVKHAQVSDFIENVLVLNYKKISGRLGTNRNEMERIMTIIIQDRTGVKFNEIIPSAIITTDLGID